MQQMLISDANILIDLECCQLIELMFALPYKFCTPDILFDQELKNQHSHLLVMGLQVLSLNSDSMTYVFGLQAIYQKTSLHDLMALSLAKQEGCPLLTGDKALREASQKEAVVIHGTIWVLEQLVIHQKVTLQSALNALVIMQAHGRRLPFDMAKEALLALPV
ncbi:MAG: PIN domain-containing protein [Moraxella sp.]|nr:PIN domain-containing protein [Moraxella sp.]